MSEDSNPSKQSETLHTITGFVGYLATGFVVFKIWQTSWVYALLAALPVFALVMVLQFILMAPFFRRTPEGKLKAAIGRAAKEGRLKDACALTEEYQLKFNPGGDAAEVVETPVDGTPVGNAEFSEQMLEMAAMHVDGSRRHFSMELDFAEASLEEVDRGISEFHSGPVLAESTYYPYLAYVGEVIRRNLGGHWVEDPERGPMIQSDDPSFGVFPYAWVKKRFEEGEDESIAYKYQATKKLVSGTETLSTNSPDSSVPEVDSGSEASEITDSIARAPALVFMMVGGADGEIGAEKLEVLSEVIDGVESHPCRLFATAITMMAAEAETQFVEGFGSPIIVISELSEMRAEVEKVFPDQAEELSRALHDFGEKVAKHPTGQVSEPAAAALRLVGVGLGLDDER